MTIDEKAFDNALKVLGANPDGTFELLDSGNIRNFLHCYESAKQSNLLALLESPEVVEAGARGYMKEAHPAWNPDQCFIDDKTPNWQLYADGIKSALAAITSFIEGDGSAAIAPVAGETDYSTSLTPTSFIKGNASARKDEDGCGGQLPLNRPPSPTSYAEPTAPDSTDTGQPDELARLREELAERDASFNLRWKADMRAIKRWQEATGRTLVWPDHADLCVWLLEQLESRPKRELSTPRRIHSCDIAGCITCGNPEALGDTDVESGAA